MVKKHNKGIVLAILNHQELQQFFHMWEEVLQYVREKSDNPSKLLLVQKKS